MDEQARLASLADLHVMDTPAEARFDRLTALACDLFDAPIALVSLVDDNRQWFKSKVGLEACSTDRSIAFCAHAIELGPRAVMVVENATLDPRFAASPLVTGDPHIRFYMGATLTTAEGFNLGTLCVIDTKPRPRPDARDLRRLQQLAEVVVDELELGRAVRESSEKRKMLEQAETMSGVGHWRLDLRTNQVRWSDAVYSIHGVDQDSFDPNLDRALDHYHPDDRDKAAGAIAAAIATKSGFDFELRLLRPNGEIRDVMSRGVVELDADEAVALVGVFQDVTEQNRRVAAAQLSEQRYRILADHAGDMITRYDFDGRGVYVSPAVEPLLGYTPSDHIGGAMADFFHPEEADLVVAAFAKLRGGQLEQTVQHRSRHKDGYYVWLESNLKLVRDDAGQGMGIIAVSRNITERKALEAAMISARDEAREQAQRALLAEDLAGVGYWRVELASGTLTMSPKMYEIFGLDPDCAYTAAEVLRRIHPDQRDEGRASVSQRLQSDAPSETVQNRIVRPDGALRHVRGSSIVERAADGRKVAFVGTVTDVTDQVEAGKKIAESEARYRHLAEEATDVITRFDLNGILTFLTPSAKTMLGYDPQELVGTSTYDLIHPDDRFPTAELFRDLEAAGPGAKTPQIRYRARHKDGRWIWVEGRPRYIFDVETGAKLGVQDVVRDISIAKAAEEALEQARRQAEASGTAKAEFLANMSHELRTPLTAVLGFSRLIQEQPELSPISRRFVGRVMSAGNALLASVNDILDFSKLEAGQIEIKPRPASPTAILQDVADLLSVQANEKGLDLTLELENLPETLLLDIDRIRQVLLNLVGNAVKFTSEGSVALSALYNRGSGLLTVSVRDTGPGIPPDLQDKLFQRFSQVDGSSTRVHGGTGLGLAICKGLVEAMRGSIAIESAAGNGATFTFTIPALEAEVLTIKPQVEAGGALPFECRILVADDNSSNIDLVSRILTVMGAEVTAVSDGQAALDMALRQPFDAILMDLRMPGMAGADAARAIRSGSGANAQIPILAFSADVTGELDRDLFDGLVAKPINPGALLGALVAAFDDGVNSGSD